MRTSNVEYDAMLERLLTQETSFLRYPGLFSAFQQHVLPQMQERKFSEKEPALRIWSAGCASGEEPYSIALSIREATDSGSALNASIMATDISREALERADRGVYSERSLENLSPLQIASYFTRGDEGYKVKPELREMVKFAPMNLAEPLYLGRFDCIFCMNVLIYFGEELRNRLIQRFYEYLEPGGYLFLGHAESVASAPVKFNHSIHEWSPAPAEAARPHGPGRGGGAMNGASPEMIELFLTEASEHLQFLREYSGILQDPYPLYEDIERLYISAHGVAGTGGTYGYEFFHEVAGKLAHIFQYAMNATVSPEATAPLVEFIYEAIAVLESDLIMISAGGTESVEDIAAFKQRYPFAFQAPPPAIDAPTEQPHAPEPELERPAPTRAPVRRRPPHHGAAKSAPQDAPKFAAKSAPAAVSPVAPFCGSIALPAQPAAPANALPPRPRLRSGRTRQPDRTCAAPTLLGPLARAAFFAARFRAAHDFRAAPVAPAATPKPAAHPLSGSRSGGGKNFHRSGSGAGAGRPHPRRGARVFRSRGRGASAGDYRLPAGPGGKPEYRGHSPPLPLHAYH